MVFLSRVLSVCELNVSRVVRGLLLSMMFLSLVLSVCESNASHVVRVYCCQWCFFL